MLQRFSSFLNRLPWGGFGPLRPSESSGGAAEQNGALLPQDGKRIKSPLLWVVAIMCFLASLALGGMLSVTDAAERWSRGLAGTITVQVKPDESMGLERQVQIALNILSTNPGIEWARPLSTDDTRELLEPWLGRSDVLQELPIPRLIEVKLDYERPANLERLTVQLRDQVPGAVLDDHRRWNDRLMDMANTLKWLAIGILMLVTSATVTIIVFATRAGLASNHQIVEVLHLIGAQDQFIAREFQQHFSSVGLRAGLIGALGACLVFLTLGRLGGAESSATATGVLPSLALGPSVFAFLLLVPLLASLVALITARITVLRTLGAVL